MADGNFYLDSKPPFVSADAAAVTLTTTNKALLPVAALPVLGANYFGFVGKGIRYKLAGRITTGVTPGNGQFSILYGTGADANGVSVVASAAFALTASLANAMWMAEVTIRCRTMGAAGTLFGTGKFELLNSATAAAAASIFMIPATAPAPSAAVDLSSATLLLSPQFLRSGSTAETMQVHEYAYEVLN